MVRGTSPESLLDTYQSERHPVTARSAPPWPRPLDLGPGADRVKTIDAKYAGAWELPVVGKVAAPAAVLIRPDGHVAWVGDGTDRGLREALTRWF